MPEKTTLERARRDKKQGKAATTQAGEFVREEVEHVREGKHGARSAKQAIAIGLSKARRAGVHLPPPRAGTQKRSTRMKAAADARKGTGEISAPRTSAKRSRAAKQALTREGSGAVSRQALSRQAKSAAAKRGSASRSAAARKAARTRKAPSASRRGR